MVGLADALAVAKGGPMRPRGQAEILDAKLLSFFLRDGECTAEISESIISVWYSWLPRPKPSTYFINLAPGLVNQLMRLGEVQRIADEASFQVRAGTAGTGPYIFNFETKWVRIRCEDARIIIKVRDRQEDLNDSDPEHFGKVVRCERCDSELRTSLAKQCFHCGFDWH
jgi:hypothetical protein